MRFSKMSHLRLLQTTILTTMGALVLALGLSSCYILKQGTILLSFHSKAESVEELIRKQDLDPQTRIFLERVQDIRSFATDTLGLETNSNYTRYVELEQNHLAYVVSATDKISFTPHEWKFPIVGKVPYKGFFQLEDAKTEAERLRDLDLDVWIRTVDAFSTLGYFSDPLYSFMKSYKIHQLAELIIHEQAHATLYVKGQSQFNEEFATFVGREGARLYIRLRFGESSPEYATLEAWEKDQKTFLQEVQQLIRILEDLYATPLTREEKLRRKAILIQEFQQKFLASYEQLFQTESFKGFSKLPVNNAYLYLYRLYYPENQFFQRLYLDLEKDLPRLLQVTKRIKGKKGDPYTLIEEEMRNQRSRIPR
ncbi:MAG: aminopeptidase [Spirochaetes bacterium]|nr:aminopeptidase [Spirochaetota bacterium]